MVSGRARQSPSESRRCSLFSSRRSFMRTRVHGRRLGLLAAALLTIQWSLTAQTPSATTASAKRPISYDVVDSWRLIQGTRLSQDGQWLAYALTAQGDDGELVVRNLGGGQEFKAPRGTNPSFTPDGRFVVFTIAQTKADEERERQESRRNNAQGGGATGRGNRGARDSEAEIGR